MICNKSCYIPHCKCNVIDKLPQSCITIFIFIQKEMDDTVMEN